MAAVQQNGFALLHVPKHLRYLKEICVAAVRQTYRVLWWPELSPPSVSNTAMCKAAAAAHEGPADNLNKIGFFVLY